jgi:hypothetical protein
MLKSSQRTIWRRAGNIGITKIVVSTPKALELIWVTKIGSKLGERFESVETVEIKIEVTFEKHLESKYLKPHLVIIYEEVARMNLWLK